MVALDALALRCLSLAAASNTLPRPQAFQMGTIVSYKYPATFFPCSLPKTYHLTKTQYHPSIHLSSTTEHTFLVLLFLCFSIFSTLASFLHFNRLILTFNYNAFLQACHRHSSHPGLGQRHSAKCAALLQLTCGPGHKGRLVRKLSGRAQGGRFKQPFLVLQRTGPARQQQQRPDHSQLLWCGRRSLSVTELMSLCSRTLITSQTLGIAL